MARDTLDKLTAEPIKVRFGKKDFNLRPLPLRKARAFRKALDAVIRKVAGFAGGLLDSSPGGLGRFGELPVNEQVGQILQLVDMLFDEDLVTLGKLAIPELADMGDEWIEENVTSAELQHVLEEAVIINFPLLTGFFSLIRMGLRNPVPGMKVTS